MNTPPALRTCLRTAAIAGVTGASLPALFSRLYPAPSPLPLALIASSFALYLAGIGLTLAWLPKPDAPGFAHLRAWLSLLVVSAIGLAGLYAGGGRREPLALFAAIWATHNATALLLFGLHALLSIFCGPTQETPRALCLFCAMLLTTAIFWTRVPIDVAARAGQRDAATALTNAVLKLSPPMQVAAVWYAAAGAPETGRLDLIRGTLTYEVWLGSYQALPYPEIWPVFGATFRPGIILPCLVWGIPILLGCGLLKRRNSRARRCSVEAVPHASALC